MLDHIRAWVFGLLSMLGIGSPASYQGYGEGDYVLASPQIAGTVETLNVVRGQNVHEGDVLFTLEHASEQAAVDMAKAQIEHDQAMLADLLKARRAPEISTMLAARDEADAALRIADINYTRDLKQIKLQAISQATLDADHAAQDQAQAKLAQANADLENAKLPTGRDDAILAAQANVGASKAALAQAQWKLDQKKLTSTGDAFVFDTIYRVGEYVKEGQPVVSLLPPENVHVRFFVPGTVLPKIKMGGAISVSMVGEDNPLAAHVTYIAPQAEYSPPELYNRANRDKLLFMIEATPDKDPQRIHPGLPVDVVLEAGG